MRGQAIAFDAVCADYLRWVGESRGTVRVRVTNESVRMSAVQVCLDQYKLEITMSATTSPRDRETMHRTRRPHRSGPGILIATLIWCAVLYAESTPPAALLVLSKTDTTL